MMLCYNFTLTVKSLITFLNSFIDVDHLQRHIHLSNLLWNLLQNLYFIYTLWHNFIVIIICTPVCLYYTAKKLYVL